MPIFAPMLDPREQLRNALAARDSLSRGGGEEEAQNIFEALSEDEAEGRERQRRRLMPRLAEYQADRPMTPGLRVGANQPSAAPAQAGLESLGQPQPQPQPEARRPDGGRINTFSEGPRYMPDIGTAMAAAAERARTGKSLDEIYAQAGTPGAAVSQPMRQYRGPKDLAFLRDEAMKGNEGAEANLVRLAQNPALANMIYGQAEFERNAAGEAEERRRFDLLAGQKDRQFYEGARQFDAGLADKAAQREVEAEFRRNAQEIERRRVEGTLTLQQAQAEHQKNLQWAGLELDKKKAEHGMGLADRQQGLAEDQFDASVNDPAKIAQRRMAGKRADLELKVLERQAEGLPSAGEQGASKANLIAQANQMAASLKQQNPTMPDAEIRNRVFQQMGPMASAAGIELDPGAIASQESFVGTGLQDLGRLAGELGSTPRDIFGEARGAVQAQGQEGYGNALWAGGPIAKAGGELGLGVLNWGRRQLFDPGDAEKQAMVNWLVLNKSMDPRQAEALVAKGGQL